MEKVTIRVPDYIKVPKIPTAGLSANEILVWQGLCSFASWVCDKKGRPIHSVHGKCYPPVERLARASLLSVRSVQRSLAVLEERGFIQIVRHAGGKNNFELFPCGDAPSAAGDACRSAAPAPAPVSALAKIVELEAAGKEVPEFLRRVAAIEREKEAV